jgi:DNA primase
MARYTDDSRDRVREAVDMVDLVGTRVDLRRAGVNRFEGLCPFHDERTPSFGINPAEKLFYCFGCSEGGDAFKFVQLTEGLDFKAALEYLADRYGVQLEIVEEDAATARRRQERARLIELLERTAAFYVRYLWESSEAAHAREYLTGRGLAEGTLREFRVGYAPSAWDKVLVASRRAGFSDRELVEAGLASRAKGEGRTYDRFRRRIMFPLCDARGNVLGFGARAMGADQKPKYVNSSDNSIYHKGRQVFGADIARAPAAKAGVIIVAEGYTDVLAMHQGGLRNTVGLMGTALTEGQVRVLRGLARTVLLALDADDAGKDAMLRASRLAQANGIEELKVVALPPGKDPAELVQAEGARSLQGRVDQALELHTFLVRRVLETSNVESGQGKRDALGQLKEIVAGLPRDAAKFDLLAHIASRLRLSEEFVWTELAGPAVPASSQPRAAPTSIGNEREETGHGVGSRILGHRERMERELLALCVAQGPAATELLAQHEPGRLFSSDLHRRVAEHLAQHPTNPAMDLSDDDELNTMVAGLVARASQLLAAPASLEAQLREIELDDLERSIADARISGAGEVAALALRRQELRRLRDDAVARAIDQTQARAD